MSESLINLNLDELSPSLLDAGFGAVGAVDFELAWPLYQEHARHYQNWIDSKKHGEMEYLRRGLERRLNPKLVFPELNSVLAVILPYTPHPIGASGLRYARYLNGPDYHDVIKEKLEKTIQFWISEKKVPDSFRYKVCVDTSSVLERSWAMLCGLGWIGKNTLLIHPKLGSYFFLGIVFMNALSGREPILLKDYCGACTRCIKACPTEALVPHSLDANKCISYLTLEKRGEWEKAPITTKGYLAGCDLCQEVCPYNTKAVRSSPIIEPSPHLELNFETLFNESEEDYRARVLGTSLSRIKYQDFKRNLNATTRS